MDHTPADTRAKIAEIKRELAYRKAVYGKLIAAGKLDRARANRQVFVLECILRDYSGEHPSKLPLVAWSCPICEGQNHTRAGEPIIYCRKDETQPDHCGGGPFLLLQVRGNRALEADVHYEARRVEGIDYPVKQRGLDL